MDFGSYYLLEAFSQENMERVLALIKTTIEKQLGQKFYEEHGINQFKNSEGSGVGLRYFIGSSTQAIRFNFNTRNEVISVDIWDKESNNKDPKIRFETSGQSIAQIIPTIVNYIKNPVEESVVVEDNKVVTKRISGEEWIDTQAAKDQKIFNKIKYANPNIVFNDMKLLVQMVITGQRNSLIISGIAGAGKSFTVRQYIINSGLLEGTDFVVIKGKSTPLAIYQTLYDNNGKLIIYDDCDAVLKNKDGLNILKAALDTDKIRAISWKSAYTFNPNQISTFDARRLEKKGKYVDQFDFSGRVIFITNLYINQIDKALRDRSFVVDVTLRAEDILLRIESILPEIMKDDPAATPEIKQEVLEYFKWLVRKRMLRNPMSIRSYESGIKLRLSGHIEWQRLIQRYA